MTAEGWWKLAQQQTLPFFFVLCPAGGLFVRRRVLTDLYSNDRLHVSASVLLKNEKSLISKDGLAKKKKSNTKKYNK